MRFQMLAMALVMVAGSLVRADLVLDFKTTAGKDAMTQGDFQTTDSGWYRNTAPDPISLFYTTASTTANLTTNTSNLFTANVTGSRAGRITLTHNFSFATDGNGNAKDGGGIFYRAGTSGNFTQITDYVSGFNYNSTTQPFNPSFAITSGGNVTSTFAFDTVAGTSYQFQFRGVISDSGNVGTNLTSGSSWDLQTLTVTSVPEPGTLILGGIGSLIAGAGYGLRRLRGRKVAASPETVEEAVSV